MEAGRLMRVMLSRKGFDSSAGRVPSPILPDGRLLSLPIPDRQSPIRYGDLRFDELNVGAVVATLTGGRIPVTHFAHLDPDLRRDSLPREPGWRPLFGQTGAAQGHLRKNRVQTGDLFLFFGLYQPTVREGERLVYAPGSRPQHVLWGWLQIDEIVTVDTLPDGALPWARYHPHFHRRPEPNNTVYVAREQLALDGLESASVPGGGTFPTFDPRLRLTAPDSDKPSQWELPGWFHPGPDRPPLTYHADVQRWSIQGDTVRLSSAARGQEFVLDTAHYPEATRWIADLLR